MVGIALVVGVVLIVGIVLITGLGRGSRSLSRRFRCRWYGHKLNFLRLFCRCRWHRRQFHIILLGCFLASGFTASFAGMGQQRQRRIGRMIRNGTIVPVMGLTLGFSAHGTFFAVKQVALAFPAAVLVVTNRIDSTFSRIGSNLCRIILDCNRAGNSGSGQGRAILDTEGQNANCALQILCLACCPDAGILLVEILQNTLLTPSCCLGNSFQHGLIITVCDADGITHSRCVQNHCNIDRLICADRNIRDLQFIFCTHRHNAQIEHQHQGHQYHDDFTHNLSSFSPIVCQGGDDPSPPRSVSFYFSFKASL